MAELPRRRSKLVGTHPAERHEDELSPSSPRTEINPTAGRDVVRSASSELVAQPGPTEREPAVAPGPSSSEPARPTPRRRGRGPAPLVSRNPRRLPRGQVSGTDMVSFNCKMSRDLRRRVRILAANNEVDIQDVVAAALEDYLAARVGNDSDDSLS